MKKAKPSVKQLRVRALFILQGAAGAAYHAQQMYDLPDVFTVEDRQNLRKAIETIQAVCSNLRRRNRA